MKIKTVTKPYAEVLALPRPAHKKPLRPSLFFRTLMRTLGKADLKATHFSYTTHRMELCQGQPCLILMNHSSFIDLSIVAEVFARQPYCIVCTSDGFVGKEWLMRHLGCIPTKKFVTDVSLIGDIRYALHTLHTSVLMYPEASYTFDGTATPLPRKMGVLLKRLGVPVVMITAHGAFARDPLYNCLQKRQVDVNARAECLLTPEEIAQSSVQALDDRLDEAFSFDHFTWQEENRVEITEPFRADGLSRILYRCAHCGAEGQMEGKGTQLRCGCCGKTYTLDTLGRLQANEGETEFPHIPDWYAWERDTVRRAILDGSYALDTDVDIGVMVDFKAIYMVGGGHLRHDAGGFTLTGCEGQLRYQQPPKANYSLYADYYWYELGDVICIGDGDVLYYCFPKKKDVVARTRIAAEELYKLRRKPRREKANT